MDYGALSSYFDGAVSKTLADVDIDRDGEVLDSAPGLADVATPS